HRTGTLARRGAPATIAIALEGTGPGAIAARSGPTRRCGGAAGAAGRRGCLARPAGAAALRAAVARKRGRGSAPSLGLAARPGTLAILVGSGDPRCRRSNSGGTRRLD